MTIRNVKLKMDSRFRGNDTEKMDSRLRGNEAASLKLRRGKHKQGGRGRWKEIERCRLLRRACALLAMTFRGFCGDDTAALRFAAEGKEGAGKMPAVHDAGGRAAVHGFSLVEVLFAVMVLGLGLIFVAAQFPLGLANSREVADATVNLIDAHNARVMMELELEGALATPGMIGTGGGGAGVNGEHFVEADGAVRFYCQPNVRLASNDIVMDDPCNVFYPVDPELDPVYPLARSQGGELPPYIYGTTYAPVGTIEPRSMGQAVSPRVHETDREVLELLPEDSSVWTDEQIDAAVYEVAMGRRYCWRALYQCLDSGGQGNVFRFFIFTMRKPEVSVGYGVEDIYATRGIFGPVAWSAEEDRMFPVPWLVQLYTAINPNDIGMFPDGPEVDRFLLNDFTENDGDADAIEKILREGSVLVDEQKGHVYEVMEITEVVDGWELRLTSNLNQVNYLQRFWVFPPAIVGHDPDEFGDDQPVLSVVEKIVRLN